MKNKIIDIVHDIILNPVADALRNGGEKLTGTEDVKTVLEKTKKFVQKSGVNPADATVTAGDILAGKTAYGSDGKKLTGTIASKSAQTYTPGTADQTIAAGQYLTGLQVIKGDRNLTAGNIIKGKSIFGVAGTLPGASTYYQCTAVSGTTWSGKKLVLDANGNYSISDTVKSGLLCSGFTPEVGGIYLEDSRIFVADYWAKIMPMDTAFNIPMDAVNGSQFVPPPNEYSVWAPNTDYYQAAEFDGVKCLQIRYSSGAVVGQGSLWFADNGHNDSTALYGPGQLWTFSFWFYPYSNTGEKVGDNGRMFDLGDYNNTQLTLYYNDNNGSFKIGTTDGSYISTAEWGGYAPYGQWSHVCITAESDAKTYKLYINGQFAATTLFSENMPASFNEHMGFPAFHGNGRTACGGFAKLKWYNRVLREGEIAALAEEI